MITAITRALFVVDVEQLAFCNINLDVECCLGMQLLQVLLGLFTKRRSRSAVYCSSLNITDGLLNLSDKEAPSKWNNTLPVGCFSSVTEKTTTTKLQFTIHAGQKLVSQRRGPLI